MNKIIVADTGPIIALALVGILPQLPKMFASVLVPRSVLDEATNDSDKPAAQTIKQAVKQGILTQCDPEMSSELLRFSDVLDRGESEALALAHQMKVVALIDEQRGRKIAARYGIAVTGSAALLIKAKKMGLVSEVKPLLNLLRERGYRLSDSLCKQILILADEN